MSGILQILFDDLGFQDFGVQGHPDILTPEIDAIAAAGTRYTKFLATPACTTTRVCLMTGRLPQFFGVHGVDAPSSGSRYWLPAHTATVAKRLRRLGWKTAHFGKTHWGAPPHTLHPARFGYDKFLGVMHGLANAQFSGYTRVLDSHLHDGTSPPQVYDGFADDVLVDEAIAWITARENAGEDWYCELWFFIPHEPLGEWTADEFDLYPTPTYSSREQTYYGAISHADTKIGEIMTALTDLGALSTTTIAVGSENGPEPHDGAHPNSAGLTAPYRGWKTSLYMGGIAVPWIMRGPDFSAGVVDDRFRGIEDWVPTVLEIAGYDTSHIVGGLPGKSLTTTPATRYLCREYHKTPKASGVTPPVADNEWTCVKADGDSKWKLYRTSADGTGDKLFDLSTDAGEETDVASSNAAILSELQGELDTWVASWPDESANGHSFDGEDPQTEAEAVAVQPEPFIERLLVRCEDASDRTAKAALIEKALGIPAEISCSHGFSAVTMTSYGGINQSHPTELNIVALRVGREVTQWADDAEKEARLTTAEQGEFNELCIEAADPAVP